MENAAVETRVYAAAGRTVRPLAFVVVIGLIAAVALACVWTRYQSYQTGYRLGEIRTAIKGARAEHRRLTVALSALKSPDNLERHAERLGLQKTSVEQVRKIR